MNSKKTLSDRVAFESFLQHYNHDLAGFHESELYGIVYYFHRRKTNQDADNLSKPIWDTLKGILFKDDNCIKFRIAGVFDLSENDFQTIDVTNLDATLINDLLAAIGSADHIVYVECGRMRNDFFRFNIE